MIELKPVESEMIAAAGYDPQDRLLVVLFNNGKAYEYHDVPAEEYTGLMAAESKGSFMQTHILKTYSYAPFRGWKKKKE